MSKEIKYMHLWVVGKKVGRATVAYRRSEDRTGVVFAVAFCSPNDEYTRAEGRRRAGDRLNSGQAIFLPYVGTKNYWDLMGDVDEGFNAFHLKRIDWRPAAAILEELNLSADIFLPNWARNADFVFEPFASDRADYRPKNRVGTPIPNVKPIVTTLVEISEPAPVPTAIPVGEATPVKIGASDDDTIPF